MRSPAATADGTAAPAPGLVSVLVVDDSATKRLALSAVLAPLGHDVVEADSGRAALRCVMARQFAVILLDVRMPSMDGFETAAAIRQREQSELTPIIFITAHANDEVRAGRRYADGAVDFICAPVRPDELRAKVTAFARLFLQSDALASKTREAESASDCWKLLLDLVPVGVFRTDGDGRHVYTNGRWSELTGIAADEVVGRTAASVFGLGRDGVDGVVVTDERVAVTRRFELHTPGTPVRVVEMTQRRMPDLDGSPAGWVGTLEEITAEAATAAALASACVAVATMQDDLATLATAMREQVTVTAPAGGHATTSAA